MALTATLQADVVPGSERFVFIKVTGDASYPAGGYPITPGLFGLNSFMTQKFTATPVNPILVSEGSASGAMIVPDVDVATGNLRFYYPTGGSVASPGTLAQPLGTGATGATAVTSSAATVPVNLTPGQGKEVATGANLSTISVGLLGIGH